MLSLQQDNMEVAALCIKLMLNFFLLLTVRGEVFLRIDPNKLQFFEYESISLRCAGSHGLTEWRVMNNLPSQFTQWETSAGSLNITPALVSDSGQYFCENEKEERSNSINITITAGDVILESPALPVREGDNVVLRCRTKSFSNPPSDFCKDGIFIKTDYSGKMTFLKISTSDEGLYKCSISGSGGESAESWLTVTVTPPEKGQETPSPPHPSSIQLSILLSIILTVFCLSLLLLVVGILQCRKHRGLCFSSDTPTPDPVYEDVAVSVPQAALNTVTKQKRKGGCQKDNVANSNNVTYAAVNVKRKEGVSRERNVTDPNRTTYALIMQRTETGC
ncbi:low affinity immunoglobulin gamma Fc region receptor III-B-like [Channa argus]|uniref:low affinity immunoglobulin gamma Fc region receptor III-B-like n=1 Tax=Channa argus TaxID=215402 RepID=UPI003522B9C2